MIACKEWLDDLSKEILKVIQTNVIFTKLESSEERRSLERAAWLTACMITSLIVEKWLKQNNDQSVKSIEKSTIASSATSSAPGWMKTFTPVLRDPSPSSQSTSLIGALRSSSSTSFGTLSSCSSTPSSQSISLNTQNFFDPYLQNVEKIDDNVLLDEKTKIFSQPEHQKTIKSYFIFFCGYKENPDEFDTNFLSKNFANQINTNENYRIFYKQIFLTLFQFIFSLCFDKNYFSKLNLKHFFKIFSIECFLSQGRIFPNKVNLFKDPLFLGNFLTTMQSYIVRTDEIFNDLNRPSKEQPLIDLTTWRDIQGIGPHLFFLKTEDNPFNIRAFLNEFILDIDHNKTLKLVSKKDDGSNENSIKILHLVYLFISRGSLSQKKSLGFTFTRMFMNMIFSQASFSDFLSAFIFPFLLEKTAGSSNTNMGIDYFQASTSTINLNKTKINIQNITIQEPSSFFNSENNDSKLDVAGISFYAVHPEKFEVLMVNSYGIGSYNRDSISTEKQSGENNNDKNFVNATHYCMEFSNYGHEPTLKFRIKPINTKEQILSFVQKVFPLQHETMSSILPSYSMESVLKKHAKINNISNHFPKDMIVEINLPLSFGS